MKAKKIYWANPHSDGGWAVQKSRFGGTISKHSTQSSAWKNARRMACGTESDAILQDQQKRIVTRHTYSNETLEED